MDPVVLAVILLFAGAIIYLVIQDWGNSYIIAADPFTYGKSTVSGQ